MTALTAHLVDRVFPPVPVRQWVLIPPRRMRYLLAWDHELCRAVTAVFLRAVMRFLRDPATNRGVTNGRSGAVAIVQRFGAALNLNVHIHALVLDGVFALGADGRPAFREGDPPSDDDVAQVLEVVRRRVDRLLDRRGHGVDDDGFAPDQWAEEAPVLIERQRCVRVARRLPPSPLDDARGGPERAPRQSSGRVEGPRIPDASV